MKRFIGQEGFTMIELMVALLIIMIALVPFVALMISGITITQANANRIEALNVITSTLESTTAIPYDLVGYYEDEFSTSNPYYPATNSVAMSYFNQVFGTNYLPGTTYPYTVPSGQQTVDLGTTACTSNCSSVTPASDLIQPYRVYKVGNLKVHVFTVVTWQNTVPINDNSQGSCAYIAVTVIGYWSNWTNNASKSTFVDPGGNNPNSFSGSGSCSSAATLASTPPPAPLNVTASQNPNQTEASTTMVVSWQEIVNSTQSPPGYFVIQYSVDPTFTTSSETTPILPVDSPTINGQVCPNTPSGQLCANYQYTITNLAPGETYYVEMWTYSQNGVGLTGPTQANYVTLFPTPQPPASSGGVQTLPGPPGCNLASVFTFSYPASGSPTSGSPDMSYKFYLNQNGTSSVNLQLGVNTSNDCSTILQNASIGAGGYSPTGTLKPVAYFPLSFVNNGIYAFTIPASSVVSIETGYYELGLFDSNHNPLPSANNQLITYLLICPYTPPAERSQVSNKC